jgi:hypothetical protein
MRHKHTCPDCNLDWHCISHSILCARNAEMTCDDCQLEADSAAYERWLDSLDGVA